MKNVFISTGNTSKFDTICDEMADPGSMIGPSLAMVTGPAGRGKSEAAKRYAAQTSAIYIPPMNIRSATMVLREIAFELSTVSPSRSEKCLSVIGEEMSKDRRLIIIDEADLLNLQILEMLRNVNERYACPIILIGEDELKGKVGSRRRIASRIRRKMEFTSVMQADIVYFVKQSLDVEIAGDVAGQILHHAKGDWRPVLTVVIAIERAMKANSLDEISPELADSVIRSR